MRSTGSCARNAGCSIAPSAGKLLVSGADAAEYLQGQLTNDVEALEPGDGQYAALLDRKGHMQADMRVLRPAAGGDLGRYRAGGAGRRPAAPRDVLDRARRDGVRRQRRAGGPLADRAAQRRDRRHRGAAGGRLRNDRGRRRRVSGRRHERRDRPDRRGGRGRAPARRSARCRRGRGLPRGGRDPPHRVRRPPLRSRDGNRDDAGRGGDRRATPSASPRAATSARRRSPASITRAGPTATCAGCASATRCRAAPALRLGEKEVGKLGGSVVSPAFGPIGLAILRREAEPGAELAVGEDGVTARVVDLPFG